METKKSIETLAHEFTVRERGLPKPVEIKTDGKGHCDNCGEDLSTKAWRLGESTGCTIRCAKEDYRRDLLDGDV